MTPEGKVKADVHKELHKRGFVRAGTTTNNWPATPTGWYYMPIKGVSMGVNGIPDFICCWNGRFLAIETKAPGKHANTSANQDARIAEIRQANGIAVVIDDVEQLKEILDARE